MKRSGWFVGLMAGVFLLVCGAGDPVYAEGEGGYGRRGSGCPGARWGADLTDAEVQQLEAERRTFHESTRELRELRYAKELELRLEMIRKEPDAKKASEIQREISRIEAELDQKRLEHRLKLRAIDPELGYGPRWGGSCREKGRGWDHFKGPGRGSGRGCDRPGA